MEAAREPGARYGGAAHAVGVLDPGTTSYGTMPVAAYEASAPPAYEVSGAPAYDAAAAVYTSNAAMYDAEAAAAYGIASASAGVHGADDSLFDDTELRQGRKPKLPGEPAKPRTAAMFYAAHRKEEMRREGHGLQISLFNAQCREEWRAMSDTAKQPFEYLERNDRARYEDEVQRWQSMPQPQAVPGIDPSRFTKCGRLKKDPQRPKHPHSAYFYYMEAHRQTVMTEYAGASVPDITRMLATQWKALGAEQRVPFEQLAVRDKERFNAEMEQCADIAIGLPSDCAI